MRGDGDVPVGTLSVVQRNNVRLLRQLSKNTQSNEQSVQALPARSGRRARPSAGRAAAVHPGRGGSPASESRAVRVTVTPAAGAPVEGRLLRIDDFVVTLVQDDGTRRTFRRNGDEPKVDVRDPLAAHRALVPGYTDKDMHNVTAFLSVIK